MQKHLKKSVKLYAERRDAFCNMLEKVWGNRVHFTKPAGGLSVWVQFDQKHKVAAIARKAAAKGLYMADGNFYNSDKIVYNSVRMGFASLNKKELDEVAAIFKSIQ